MQPFRNKLEIFTILPLVSVSASTFFSSVLSDCHAKSPFIVDVDDYYNTAMTTALSTARKTAQANANSAQGVQNESMMNISKKFNMKSVFEYKYMPIHYIGKV